jgi:hypothetical protein
MPTFDFLYWTQQTGSTLTSCGATFQVEVSMPAALEEFCTKKAIPIPAPVPGFALIDTGASHSAIDETVLQQLGILPIDSIPLSTQAEPVDPSFTPQKFLFQR